MPDQLDRGVVTRINRTLNSAIESADEAEDLTLGVAREMGFSENDLAGIGIAVREAIVNAVIHGNGSDPRKRVHFAVAANGTALAITVGDEGKGFDPAEVPDPLAAPYLLRSSGRGILLMRAAMDDFAVRNRETGGVEIRMLKRLKNP